MKKVYNSTDIHPKQGQELSKKLYRTISEQVKRLDDARRCARNIKELFTPSLQLQRRKLCDYCERLIFSDPLLYGKKIEGLLWHNGFYDVVSNAKRLKKNEYTADDISNIQTHINAGIGYYHHLISKIQSEYSLNLGTVIDFSVQLESCGESNDVKSEIIEWAQLAVHQCLIYLGDLSRYKLEIYPNWEPTLAIRYYLQAILFRPEYGMPHNQLGTLAMSQSKYLDAVYHYMRCLASKFTFDGTANNLHNLFDMNSKFIEQLPDENQNPDCIIEPGKTENIKRFIARFLLLIDIWYFNKKVSKLYSLCHQTYKDLGECLSYLKPVSSESGDTPTDIDSIESDSTAIPTYLNNDILFKIMVICLLCISKLKQSNSQQLSAVIAFTLAIYSQIIQHITNHIQESVMNYPLNTETKSSEVNGLIKNLVLGVKKSKTKMRRRKPMKADSEDESEHSANDDEDNYSSSDDSFISDTENVLACSSDEEGDTTKDSDECKSDLQDGDILEVTEGAGLDESKSTENLTKKVQKMDVNDMLEIIGEESNLQCIKIAHDWLKYDPEVIKSCGTNTRSLLRQITHLLNLININLTSPKVSGITIKISEIISKENKIPLSEDIVLKGVDILSNAHSDIDWDFIHKRTFTAKDETVIRIVKLISFGKHLMTIDDTGISFDVEKNIFVCQVIEEDDIKLPASVVEELELNDIESNTLFVNKATNLGDGDSNGALVETKGGQLMKMKHMGQLWLAAEVRALECRVKGKTSLSPYLVLDADALIKFTFMVKHLVHSRKFIVLVPTAVVSALDDLKLEKSEARDAIRWLESQFQRGNRFFRAQRPHEKASIPFIKYPKKKDKEMHIYIQIIECCHYLAEQQKDATNLVTLLIGNQNVLSNGENKEFSYVGLAQSAGISIESITQFYGKWKKTKGKR